MVVVNQPTWGVDAAAAAAIRQALLDRAAEGAAVVVISQDLDELLEIADRFAALNGGRLTAPRPVQGLTVDEIGLMMGGAHGMEVAHHAADPHSSIRTWGMRMLRLEKRPRPAGSGRRRRRFWR